MWTWESGVCLGSGECSAFTLPGHRKCLGSCGELSSSSQRSAFLLQHYAFAEKEKTVSLWQLLP